MKLSNMTLMYSTGMYFRTPLEHRKALLDGAIRCLSQLMERWPECPEATEQELAFAELALHRIRRELP